MKKLFVLLLALAMVTGAFAQVTTGLTLQGKAVLVNEAGLAKFDQAGAAYELLTFKASKDNYGFAITDENFFSGAAFDTIRDWNVYYKLAEDKIKVSFGLLRDGTFRTALANGCVSFTGTDRITGYGMFTTWMPMEGLTVGLNVPFLAGEATQTTLDTLMKADFGASYMIEDLGTLTFQANMGFAANIMSAGFTFTGVENLTAVAIYQGSFGGTSTHTFAVGADYVMDALDVGLEFAGADAAAFTWDVCAYGYYDVTEKIYTGLEVYYFSDETYDIWGNVGYHVGNGFDIDYVIGYNADIYTALSFKYKVVF